MAQDYIAPHDQLGSLVRRLKQIYADISPHLAKRSTSAQVRMSFNRFFPQLITVLEKRKNTLLADRRVGKLTDIQKQRMYAFIIKKIEGFLAVLQSKRAQCPTEILEEIDELIEELAQDITYFQQLERNLSARMK